MRRPHLHRSLASGDGDSAPPSGGLKCSKFIVATSANSIADTTCGDRSCAVATVFRLCDPGRTLSPTPRKRASAARQTVLVLSNIQSPRLGLTRPPI
jgi:hypothetical protein